MIETLALVMATPRPSGLGAALGRKRLGKPGGCGGPDWFDYSISMRGAQSIIFQGRLRIIHAAGIIAMIYGHFYLSAKGPFSTLTKFF